MMTKLCVRCGAEKPLGDFYTNGRYADGSVCYRPDCKACHTAAKRIPKSQKLYANDPDDNVFRICRRLSHDAHARVSAPSRDHKKAYRELDVPFGFKSTREMYLYLYEKFKDDISALIDQGKRPSVDRLDTTKGYGPGNIRIIDHRDNTLLGVETIKRKVNVTFADGGTETYTSVVECAEAFGTTDGHIRGWLQGKWRPRNGCSFKYA